MSSWGGLQARMNYRKFAADRLRVVLFVSGYHVQEQVRRALEAMGHRVCCIAVGRLAGACRTVADTQRALLAALVGSRPDFVLTINHIGFDQGGETSDLLQRLGVPIAAWYVDCPFLVHDGVYIPAVEMTHFFSWERAFLPLWRAAGVAHASWLPLACDPALLADSGEGLGADDDGLAQQAVFVGNSMQAPLEAWAARLSPTGRALAGQLLDDLKQGGRQAFLPALTPLRPRPDPRMTALAWATYQATAESRAGALEMVAAHLPLRVVGDAGWAQWPQLAGHRPPVPYGVALAPLYRRAAVSINLTSYQMPTAVNQRVFDVPAVSGVLLADRQQDLATLFPEDAVMTFAGNDELLDKATYLLQRPALRRRLGLRGREVTAARHTYPKRLAVIIDQLRRQRPQAAAD